MSRHGSLTRSAFGQWRDIRRGCRGSGTAALMAALLASLAVLAPAANPEVVRADTMQYYVPLTPDEVVPSGGEPGASGSGGFIFSDMFSCDPPTDYFEEQFAVSGLDTITAVAIHLGGVGTTGPVVASLPTTLTSGELFANGNLVPAATQHAIESDLAGYYVEIDTVVYPNGALRGQLDGLGLYPPQPEVSAVSPRSGGPGTSVSLTGFGFTGATGVSFNGTPARFAVNSDSTIFTAVPRGAATGSITVTTRGGSGTSASFSVGTRAVAPIITSFSPTSGSASNGDLVVITGSNLAGATSVTFGGVTVGSCWKVESPTQLYMPIPGGAASGTIAVTTAGGTATSKGSFTVTTPPSAAVLDVPFLSQYEGQTNASGKKTENFDCGPASVAMVVEYLGLRPAGLSDAAFIEDARTRTGNTAAKDTTFGQLEKSIASYGLTFEEIPASLSPAPDAQVAAMEKSIADGSPVIALVSGAALGRGKAYGDHWLVVRGFSPDGKSVYLNDPDTRTGKLPSGWINGGQITLSLSTFSAALFGAQSGPYGIIVR